MRIGVVGPLWHNIPPKTYGGTEDVVYNLVNGLANKRHEVSLFGPQTARVSAKVHSTLPFSLREKNVPWTNIGYTLLHITEAFDNAAKFDILHIHLNKIQDYFALPLALLSKTPVLFTIHFKIPEMNHPERNDRYLLLDKYRALPYVSISNAQREHVPLRYIATVYNGIDLSRFHFSNRSGNYLIWLGKVAPFKGTREAIYAAKKKGMKLYLMGKVEEGVPEFYQYYKEEIQPLIDDKQIVWLGEVSYNEKTSIIAGARALLNPIQWEEPFGLVMAEAQAAGTPVISFRRGAALELIRDGKTGFLVDSLDEMVEKITEVEHIERKLCRDNILKNFTLEKMVEGYESVYQTVIENWEKYRKEQLNLIKNS